MNTQQIFQRTPTTSEEGSTGDGAGITSPLTSPRDRPPSKVASRRASDAEQEEKKQDQLLTLFQHYSATTGTVSGEDAADIFQQMGVELEKDRLHTLLPSWEAVSIEDLLDVIEQLQSDSVAQRHGHLQLTMDSTTEVYLHEYIWYKLSCRRPPVGTTYSIKKYDITLSPREKMFALTTVCMAVVALFMLLIISLLWEDWSQSRSAAGLKNFNVIVKNLAEELDDIQAVSYGIHLEETSASLASAMEANFALHSVSIGRHLALQGEAAAATVASLDELWTIEAAELGRATNTRSSSSTLSWIQQRMQDKAATASTPVNATSNVTNATSSSSLLSVNQPTSPSSNVTPGGRPSYPSLGSARSVLRFLNNATDSQSMLFEWVDSVSLPTSLLQCGIVDSTASTACSELRSALEKYRRDETRRLWTIHSESSTGIQYIVDFSLVVVVDDEGAVEANSGGVGDKLVVSFEDDAPLVSSVKHMMKELIWKVNSEHIFKNLMEISVAMRVTGVGEALSNTSTSSNSSTPNYHTIISTSSGVAISFLTSFGRPEGCIDQRCSRNQAALQNFFSAILTRSSGSRITPDYRPMPVLGVFSFAKLDTLDLAIVMETDLTRVGEESNKMLVGIADIFNEQEKTTAKYEIHIVNLRGMPPLKVFDPDEPCEHLDVCEASVSTGQIILRSDCYGCIPWKVLPSATLQWLTKFRRGVDCKRSADFASGSEEQATTTTVCVETADTVSTESVLQQRDTHHTKGTDYSGRQVDAQAHWHPKQSVASVVLVEYGVLLAETHKVIGTGIWISVIIFVVSVVGLGIASRNAMARVEKEWNDIQEHIRQEQEQFSKTMNDAFPPYVVQRQLEGAHFFAENRPIAHLMLDICDFTTPRMKWNAEELGCFMGYFSTILSIIAERYNMTKVSQTGDIFVFCTGIARTHDSTQTQTSIRSLVEFAVTHSQLSAELYAHYPAHITRIALNNGNQSTKKLPDVVGAIEHVGCVVMPETKCAINFSSAMCYVLKLHNYESFDMYGSSLEFTKKMLHVTKKNSVILSAPAKDLLLKMPDAKAKFQFCSEQRIILRGKGVLLAAAIAAADVPLRREIVESLGSAVRESRRRIIYGSKRVDKDAESRSMSSTATYD